MQSEAGLPRIILAVYPRLSGEEGAKYRDSFRRTGPACMSTPSLFFRTLSRPFQQPLKNHPPDESADHDHANGDLDDTARHEP